MKKIGLIACLMMVSVIGCVADDVSAFKTKTPDGRQGYEIFCTGIYSTGDCMNEAARRCRAWGPIRGQYDVIEHTTHRMIVACGRYSETPIIKD